jgi:hypothetical protein
MAPGNLGYLIHHLEQVTKLIGGGIGADLYRIVDTRRLPGFGVEPTRRGHPDPSQFDSQRRGFPVGVVEDAAGCREMEQMPAGEIGFHRDAARVHRCGKRATVLEADIIVPALTSTWKRLSISNSFTRISRSAA